MPTFKLPIDIHDRLNPALWNGDKPHDEVQRALLRIAREYYKFLKVKAPIRDILISGSQANYNYSQYSDIDLHLVFDFSDIQCDEPIIELFDSKRKLWKKNHDIDIYGIPVEVYAEDSLNPAVSACYSLLKGQWVRHPSTAQVNYNLGKVKQSVNTWSRLILFAIKQQDVDLCKQVMALLSHYRKLGLKAYGEFGTPNLVYKSLRNMQLLERLNTEIHDLEDELLSLD